MLRERLDDLRHRLGGRVPWTPGYAVYKRRVIEDALDDAAVLERFRRGEPLPPGHGVAVGERAVELPWTLAHLGDGPGLVLDAGSALNHTFLLDRPALASKTLHTVTLAPEAVSHWRRGVSHVYHDLRDLPFRDGLYDVVACVSTLEHVGWDNTAYTGSEAHAEERPQDFARAMAEMGRVLRPGGVLLLTVPYGRHERHPEFQQFDRALLQKAIDAFGKAERVDATYYRYTSAGWDVASAEACADARYEPWGMMPHAERRRAPVPPDRAAAARAVACVRLVKP